MSINRTALHQAMESQQRQIEAQRRQISQLVAHASLQDGIIDYVAKLAGISKQVTAIRKKADVLNPAQPIPDPNPVSPSETTQEAATPEAYDDVRNPGATPGSLTHVPAEATTVALRPGEDLPTQPFNQLVDVQAPVENTSTQLPLNQTRIETDVRVGDPMNQEIAFPWTISQNNSNGQRTAAKSDPVYGDKLIPFFKPDRDNPYHYLTPAHHADEDLHPEAGEVHILPGEHSTNGHPQVLVTNSDGEKLFAPTSEGGPHRYRDDGIVTNPKYIDQAFAAASKMPSYEPSLDEPMPWKDKKEPSPYAEAWRHHASKQATFLSEHPGEGGHDGGGTHGWGVWDHDDADWSDHPTMAYGDHEEAPAWDRADAERAREMTLDNYRDNGFDEGGDMHKVLSVQPYNRGEDIASARARIPRHAPHTAKKEQAPVADESRTIASMRLARLQIEAGLAEESDDLSLGQKIALSERTDSEINQTIKTLESVKKAASKKQARPAHLVPRTATAGSRSTPSFAGGSGSDLSVPPSLSAEATKDTEDADLFL